METPQGIQSARPVRSSKTFKCGPRCRVVGPQPRRSLAAAAAVEDGGLDRALGSGTSGSVLAPLLILGGTGNPRDLSRPCLGPPRTRKNRALPGLSQVPAQLRADVDRRRFVELPTQACHPGVTGIPGRRHALAWFRANALRLLPQTAPGGLSDAGRSTEPPKVVKPEPPETEAIELDGDDDGTGESDASEGTDWPSIRIGWDAGSPARYPAGEGCGVPWAESEGDSAGGKWNAGGGNRGLWLELKGCGWEGWAGEGGHEWKTGFDLSRPFFNNEKF